MASAEARIASENPQNDSDSDSDSEPAPIEPPPPPPPSPSDSDSDSSYDSEYEPLSYVRPDGTVQQIDSDDSDVENTPEVNTRRFARVLGSKRLQRELEEDEEDAEYPEDQFDFPPDPENWREEDLKELWADAPIGMTKPGWDPNLVDDNEVEVITEEIKAGRDPPIAPFYVPYRKYYPVIPDNNYDISNPKAVIEELDRIEEFLVWVSFIFEDGSSYEGTVWDDMAHGKGVYIAEHGLVRYEGEWLQNQMEGHGVVEVEIPHMEPIPGSKLEAKMRADGEIISRDFMSPEDREWLEMDIEDSLKLAHANGGFEIPFYENEEWVRQFGKKPEKGRYRYAGEWKHGRMHGCGVYEVNERTTWGRFYFGELLNEEYGCDAEISALHSGIAEVAAAKARMFINKPDGMVREDRGPFSDPQHPYLYEEEDVWMAPGFINQFYEVPDYWKMYVHEVDEEREMWLNSFYKAPLRLPMPSELEYWWEKYEEPEFVLINKEPEPDPENPSEMIYTEDPVILHTPTGRIIDYVDDEEHGIRLFWQPEAKDGKEPNPDEAVFLPLGFDEFYGRVVTPPEDTWLIRFVKSIENKGTAILGGLDKWAEEKKKASEVKVELLKQEMELVEAEMELKEAMEDLDEELKILQQEEEDKAEEEERVEEKEKAKVSEATSRAEKMTPPVAEEEDADEDQDDEDDDDDDDDVTGSSFGSVQGQSSTSRDDKGSSFGKSTFAASSLAFGNTNLVSLVPRNLQSQFLRWKEGRLGKRATAPTCNLHRDQLELLPNALSLRFPLAGKSLKMRCTGQRSARHVQQATRMRSRNRAKTKAPEEAGSGVELSILSFHTPLPFT